MRAAFASLLLAATLTAQPGPISGKWHLLEASADEINVPAHRVDLVFRDSQTALTGAIINRNTGEDIPLSYVKLNGDVLTLQMAGASPDSAPAILTMTAKGDKFEGYWMRGTTEVGPMFKLVRFR